MTEVVNKTCVYGSTFIRKFRLTSFQSPELPKMLVARPVQVLVSILGNVVDNAYDILLLTKFIIVSVS